MASVLVFVAILSSDLSYASQPEKFSQTTPVLMLFLCSGSTFYQPHDFPGSQHIPFHTTIFSLFTTTVSVQPNFSSFPFHPVATLWHMVYESIPNLSFRQINASHADMCTCLCYGTIQKIMRKEFHNPIVSQRASG